MKKAYVLTLVASLLLVNVASAQIFVDWVAGSGFYWSATDDPLMGAGGSVLAQLIWTPDQTYGAADFNDENLASGNDVWLQDFVVNEADRTDGEWGWFGNNPDYDDPGGPTDGYIYARIFESLTPQVGDWYYVGDFTANLNRDSSASPPQPPQSYNMNRDTAGHGLGDPIDDPLSGFNFQVVPEPGTIGLLALGMMTLGGAAHKKRKAAVEA